MRTPGFPNPKATKEIKKLTRNYKPTVWKADEADIFRHEIPELVALDHGQVTLSELKEIRLANNRPVHVALLFRENGIKTLSMSDWANIMNSVTNLGIFGTLENVNNILELAKDIPLEYVALTDYITVRALLNLEAFDELGELFKIRAQQFNWLDEEGKLITPKTKDFQSRAEFQSFHSLLAFAEPQHFMKFMATEQGVAKYEGLAEKVFPVEIPFTGLDWVLDVDMAQFFALFDKNNILKQTLAQDEYSDLQKFLQIRQNVPVLRAK